MTSSIGMNLKRTATLLLCSVTLVLPALAQNGSAGSGPQTQGPPGGGPGGGRGGNPARRLEMMQKQLDLTPEQTEKVKVILAEGREKMMAARQDQTGSQEDRREKMMGMMKKENEKIKDVLTEDQKKKFEVMQKEQQERMKERNGNAPPAAPPA